MKNWTIKTITNKQVKQLADYILRTDYGYGDYSVEEVNAKLVELGIANNEGCFYEKLAGRKKEICDILVDEMS